MSVKKLVDILQVASSSVNSALLEHYNTQVVSVLKHLDEAIQERLVAAINSSDSDAHRHFVKTLILSDFVLDVFRQAPEVLAELLESGDLYIDYDEGAFQARLNERVGEASQVTEADLASALRQFRRREMLRFIWRDQNRLCDVSQLTTEVSLLADVALQRAHDIIYGLLCIELGVPMDSDGKPLRLVVIGMGKLGAGELNLSSDIDLIFAFAESGEVKGPKKTISHQEFFLSLGQRLIKMIDERTVDGFVFRVDMRLRPYGQSGALVQSFAALEEYYQNQGRDWERYAMIKARIVAGDQTVGAQLMTALKPFVFRRYIDFSVIEALRAMKVMIVREVQRKGLKDNVKLGSGGIREVEFIVQVFQLIRGGRDASLQQRELKNILGVLRERELLPVSVLDELLAAYIFLRNVEHALQAQHDKQTQTLPRDEFNRLRIAVAMDFDSWQCFSVALTSHREKVAHHFAEIIAPEEEQAGSSVGDLQQWEVLWESISEDEVQDRYSNEEERHVQECIEGTGPDPQLLGILRLFKSDSRVSRLQSIARERLDKVMPVLLAEIAKRTDSVQALERTLPVISAILRRSAYLALLTENPQALKHLVVLCIGSGLVARRLVQHPLLLDELIDPRTLYQPPGRQELQSILTQQMLRIELDDTEAQMEQLRYFKLSHGLRVAAAEISGALPLMKVSDYLTYIAEALLGYILTLARHDIAAKHGHLPNIDNRSDQFIIVAYGKLGGLELSHGSDLDLVFVYDGDAGVASDGDRSLDTATYYTRLGQRIIHYLNTRTSLGRLYEVDMRLRPSGNSGLLVSSCKAFLTYQNSKAWTWEHQALVRARVVAGPPSLRAWFEQARESILTRERALPVLQTEVVNMRAKMREHLLSQLKDGEMHLKHSPGGIVDIEFMVQYAVLACSAKDRSICEFTDNIRILDALQEFGFFPAGDADRLRAAYIAYRARMHQCSLQDVEAIVASEQFSVEIKAVTNVWLTLFGE